MKKCYIDFHHFKYRQGDNFCAKCGYDLSNMHAEMEEEKARRVEEVNKLIANRKKANSR